MEALAEMVSIILVVIIKLILKYYVSMLIGIYSSKG